MNINIYIYIYIYIYITAPVQYAPGQRAKTAARGRRSFCSVRKASQASRQSRPHAGMHTRPGDVPERTIKTGLCHPDSRKDELAVGRSQEMNPPPRWRRRPKCCWLEAVMRALAAASAKDGGYGSASTVHKRPEALSVPLRIM